MDFTFYSHEPRAKMQNILQLMREKEFFILTNKCGNKCENKL